MPKQRKGEKERGPAKISNVAGRPTSGHSIHTLYAIKRKRGIRIDRKIFFLRPRGDTITLTNTIAGDSDEIFFSSFIQSSNRAQRSVFIFSRLIGE